MFGRKKRRRHSRSAAVYIPVCSILVILLSIYGLSVFLRVAEIEVAGASMYTPEEIITASGLMPGDNLLFLDGGQASRIIQSEKPFISEAKITRVMPSAVLIEIKESTALASVEYRENLIIIDSSCRILRIADVAPQGMIEVKGITIVEPAEGNALVGEQGSETQLLYLKDVLSAIEKEGIEKDISYLDITSISNISFEYAGRFTVILGGLNNVRHKLGRLPGIIAEIDAVRSSKSKGDIDLSDSSGKWRFNPQE